MGAAFQSRAGRRATADPTSHTPIHTIVPSQKSKLQNRWLGKKQRHNASRQDDAFTGCGTNVPVEHRCSGMVPNPQISMVDPFPMKMT